jgi:hypothetical protein
LIEGSPAIRLPDPMRSQRVNYEILIRRSQTLVRRNQLRGKKMLAMKRPQLQYPYKIKENTRETAVGEAVIKN